MANGVFDNSDRDNLSSRGGITGVIKAGGIFGDNAVVSFEMDHLDPDQREAFRDLRLESGLQSLLCRMLDHAKREYLKLEGDKPLRYKYLRASMIAELLTTEGDHEARSAVPEMVELGLGTAEDLYEIIDQLEVVRRTSNLLEHGAIIKEIYELTGYHPKELSEGQDGERERPVEDRSKDNEQESGEDV